MADWQVGDLAVCVDTSSCGVRGTPCPFALGEVNRVTIAKIVKDDLGREQLALGFAKTGTKQGWNAKWFRKIQPAEPCFTEAMRNLKPRVEV